MLRIGLVGCGKAKGDRPSPARLLYTSHLFRLASTYAERHYDRWFVLSAKHGLLLPEETIAPYDQRLASSKADQQRFGALVSAQVARYMPARLFVHAGAEYVSAVRLYRECEAPLAGLAIGKQKAWYLANTRTQP